LLEHSFIRAQVIRAQRRMEIIRDRVIHASLVVVIEWVIVVERKL
jgi:hypothetical protein